MLVVFQNFLFIFITDSKRISNVFTEGHRTIKIANCMVIVIVPYCHAEWTVPIVKYLGIYSDLLFIYHLLQIGRKKLEWYLYYIILGEPLQSWEHRVSIDLMFLCLLWNQMFQPFLNVHFFIYRTVAVDPWTFSLAKLSTSSQTPKSTQF